MDDRYRNPEMARQRSASRSPGRSKSPSSRKKSNMSREQLLQALKKKKECNAKAQETVEKLLTPVEDKSDFMSSLKFINQSHFEDVLEERAIEKLCGWPLCRNGLDEVPKQQYKIDLSNKKVFDITERKMFCSGNCYKASNYLKAQLLTSPLWLRDKEDIPEFKLLSLEND